MSQKLQNFKFTRGSAKYAWDKWCDGNVWKLEIGKDFTSKLEIFRAAFSGQCKRKNLRGMTQTTPDKKYVVIQAVEKPKEKGSRKKPKSKK